MSLTERKRMMLDAIKTIKDKLVMLRYYDGIKSFEERDAEIEVLQKHLHCAHDVLVIIAEEEVGQLDKVLGDWEASQVFISQTKPDGQLS